MSSFCSKNVSIPPSPKIPQGAKCVHTPSCVLLKFVVLFAGPKYFVSHTSFKLFSFKKIHFITVQIFGLLWLHMWEKVVLGFAHFVHFHPLSVLFCLFWKYCTLAFMPWNMFWITFSMTKLILDTNSKLTLLKKIWYYLKCSAVLVVPLYSVAAYFYFLVCITQWNGRWVNNIYCHDKGKLVK